MGEHAMDSCGCVCHQTEGVSHVMPCCAQSGEYRGMENRALEQWARDILELAVKECLVRMPSEREWGGGPHPQARSAGELVAVANMLKALVVEHDRKWQGHAHGTHPRPEEPAAMPERRVNTCSNGACGLNYYDHNATLCPRCSQCAECRSAKERGMVPLHTWLPNGNNAHSEVNWRG